MNPPRAATSNPWLIRIVAYFLLATPAAVVTALVSPTVDALSMLLLWVPLWVALVGLFELGFFLYRRSVTKEQ